LIYGKSLKQLKILITLPGFPFLNEKRSKDLVFRIFSIFQWEKEKNGL
jgi:hypothetical protein